MQRHPQERSGRRQLPNALEHRGDKEMFGKEEIFLSDRRSILNLKCPYQISLCYVGKDGVVSFDKESKYKSGTYSIAALLSSINFAQLPLP